MTFTDPVLFQEAIAKLAERGITPSGMDSAMWRDTPVAIRERAFFSSRVESARVLQAMHDYNTEFLHNSRFSNGALVAQGRAEFVADMRELAIAEGLGKIDPETGKITPEIRESDLTDIRSIARLQLIFDTQTESAQEFGYFAQGQDPAILDVFPAQQFIRVRPVKAPRSYHSAASGSIRRKDDLAFWLSMNRDFNVPWGPWGFNSGMGVKDVDRNEAIAAGVISPKDTVRPIQKSFNEDLSASIRDLSGGIAAALARITRATPAAGRLAPTAATAPELPTTNSLS
jgi:hypothetical protein